jgi:hypothetical protein
MFQNKFLPQVLPSNALYFKVIALVIARSKLARECRFVEVVTCSVSCWARGETSDPLIVNAAIYFALYDPSITFKYKIADSP